MTEPASSLPSETLSPETLRLLVDQHRRFLKFLGARVQSQADAEEILQDAFVRSLSSAVPVRDESSATAWFYRLLRNSLIDYYRKRSVERRVRAEGEPALDEIPFEGELERAVCQCVKTLLPTLKPAYAHAIERVDLEEVSVAAYAAEQGISPNNASVRLHRAREALRARIAQSCGTCAEHGCVDCDCDVAASCCKPS